MDASNQNKIGINANPMVKGGGRRGTNEQLRSLLYDGPVVV